MFILWRWLWGTDRRPRIDDLPEIRDRPPVDELPEVKKRMETISDFDRRLARIAHAQRMQGRFDGMHRPESH